MEQLEQEDLDKIIKEQSSSGKKGQSTILLKDDGITIESLLVRFTAVFLRSRCRIELSVVRTSMLALLICHSVKIYFCSPQSNPILNKRKQNWP